MGASGRKVVAIKSPAVSRHALARRMNKATARRMPPWCERPLGQVQNTYVYFLANKTAWGWKQAAETFGRRVVVVKSQVLDIRIRRRTKWATSGGSGLWFGCRTRIFILERVTWRTTGDRQQERWAMGGRNQVMEVGELMPAGYSNKTPAIWLMPGGSGL